MEGFDGKLLSCIDNKGRVGDGTRYKQIHKAPVTLSEEFGPLAPDTAYNVWLCQSIKILRRQSCLYGYTAAYWFDSHQGFLGLVLGYPESLV